jgi:cytoskeletal protein RodZ
VSIGGTLAEARHQAGLTVADVSASTRIREGLIRAIEQDRFDACGGDFYARGHIRAIALAVGADPESLVGEYDAAHPAGRPLTLEELTEQQSGSPRGGHWGRRLVPVAYVLCLVVVGLAAIRLTSGTGGLLRPAAASSARAAAQAAGLSAHPAPSSSPVTATPPPAAVTTVTPASATAYGPGGPSHGDNPQRASRALSGNPATPWRTDWYTTARFGNLQDGTGLLLTLDQTVTATSVTIRLGSSHGANLEVRAGTSLSDMPVTATTADAGGIVQLPLAGQPRVRYLLIWFTRLPPDSTGTYRAEVSSVTVSGSGS